MIMATREAKVASCHIVLLVRQKYKIGYLCLAVARHQNVVAGYCCRLKRTQPFFSSAMSDVCGCICYRHRCLSFVFSLHRFRIELLLQSVSVLVLDFGRDMTARTAASFAVTTLPWCIMITQRDNRRRHAWDLRAIMWMCSLIKQQSNNCYSNWLLRIAVSRADKLMMEWCRHQLRSHER